MNILKLRERFEMSQSMLADKIGVAFNTVSDYENGRVMPSMKVAWKIADLFNTSIDCVVGRRDI